MNLVYCKNAAPGSIIELDEKEFHHLQVLRANQGDRLNIFDGNGNLYEGTLASLTKKSAQVAIATLIRSEPQPVAQLHIAIAPTKNIDRVEWFLEKATEIGIHTITPIICRRSERKELRIDRLKKVMLSAAKQSLHLHMPVLNPAIKLEEFLKKNISGKKFIAYCEEHTVELKSSFEAGESITVLIGPEGDFTPEEVTMAKQAGYKAVSLGKSRLRTETASIMVSAIFAINN